MIKYILYNLYKILSSLIFNLRSAHPCLCPDNVIMKLKSPALILCKTLWWTPFLCHRSCRNHFWNWIEDIERSSHPLPSLPLFSIVHNMFLTIFAPASLSPPHQSHLLSVEIFPEAPAWCATWLPLDNTNGNDGVKTNQCARARAASYLNQCIIKWLKTLIFTPTLLSRHHDKARNEIFSDKFLSGLQSNASNQTF